MRFIDSFKFGLITFVSLLALGTAAVLFTASCTQKKASTENLEQSRLVSILDQNTIRIDGVSKQPEVVPAFPKGVEVSYKIKRSEGAVEEYQVHLFWTFQGRNAHTWFVRPLVPSREFKDLKYDDYIAADSVESTDASQHSCDIRGLTKSKSYQFELGAELYRQKDLEPLNINIHFAEQVYKLITVDLTNI